MASLNKAMLIGNLGADAELRYSPRGTAQVTCSVAVSYDKEHTEWFNVVLWGETGEKLAQYMTKGKQVFIEGRLQTRTWEKDGQRHYRTEVVAHTVTLLGGGGDGQSAAEHKRQQQAAPEYDDLPFE